MEQSLAWDVRGTFSQKECLIREKSGWKEKYSLEDTECLQCGL